MFRFAYAAGIVTLLSVCPFAAEAQVAEIIAAGTGEVALKPDRATIVAEIKTTAASAADAAAQNAIRTTAVLAQLRQMGYAGPDVVTRRFAVGPNIRYGREGIEEQGYVATNSLLVTVRELEKVGSVIDGVLGAGATGISAARFESIRRDSARAEAIAEAVRKARRDAEAAAQAAGGRLGSLIQIEVEHQRVWAEMVSEMAMSEASAALVPTPISPGEDVVRVVVKGRWEFLP